MSCSSPIRVARTSHIHPHTHTCTSTTASARRVPRASAACVESAHHGLGVRVVVQGTSGAPDAGAAGTRHEDLMTHHLVEGASENLEQSFHEVGCLKHEGRPTTRGRGPSPFREGLEANNSAETRGAAWRECTRTHVRCAERWAHGGRNIRRKRVSCRAASGAPLRARVEHLHRRGGPASPKASSDGASHRLGCLPIRLSYQRARLASTSASRLCTNSL